MFAINDYQLANNNRQLTSTPINNKCYDTTDDDNNTTTNNVVVVNNQYQLVDQLWDGLTITLMSIHQQRQQTHDIYRQKLVLRQKLYRLLSTKLMKSEKIDLYLIGSSITGMGTKSSDTDFCLILYDSRNPNKIDENYLLKDRAVVKLDQLKQIIDDSGLSRHTQVIPALVPILKFVDSSSGLEVNINLNRTVTIKNSHLLSLYNQMDGRVGPLILALKLWARSRNINSGFNNTLTSYSISLMAIFFMQSVCRPPVLPSLQQDFPHLFVDDVTKLQLNDYRRIVFRSQNLQSLGQLFHNFFKYYCLFDYRKVISVRKARLIDRDSLVTPANLYDKKLRNGKHWPHICIEEPFDRTNTSHAVYDCQMFQQIYDTLCQTYQQLLATNVYTIDMFV
ncbi:poly(A) RNA polymerase gld-2 homolog A-like [Oppia nitens]|uniref:poly(A) RNA polymerase gld-2 homolog A-like n=1 Tax=Oppia nitens TaxID=1686743 RepID=UPI0023DA5318|nr:poly(A) RNA polymerase gld-2 homolog A-like [Oppia nitens]